MELLVYIMNRVDQLDELLEKFSQEPDFRATIIDSAGMAHMLKDTSYFLNLRNLLNQSQVNSKTILMALKESDIERAIDIIESVVGSLEDPDTGVVFTLPISHAKGLIKKRD